MLLALLWLLLISPVPHVIAGLGVVLLIAMLAVDLVLGIETGWLAFRPARTLDERLNLLRDHAYQSAFRWMRWSVPALLVIGTLSTQINAVQGSAPGGVSPRFIMAFLELLVVLPTAVLAYNDWGLMDTVEQRPHRLALLSLAIPPLLLVLLAAAEPILPLQTTVQTPKDTTFEVAGATCQQYVVEKDIAGGFGGAVGFHAEVCWNGKKAFVFGDPALPLPPNVLPYQAEAMPPGGISLPDLTACTPGRAATDFVRVAQTCQLQLDQAGTMTLTAHGHVVPVPGIGARDLQVRLVVSATGRLIDAG